MWSTSTTPLTKGHRMLSHRSENGLIFLHHGDYSGDVIVRVPKTPERENEAIEIDGYVSVEIPAQDLIDFVADYVRREKIRQLEQSRASEVLGLYK